MAYQFKTDRPEPLTARFAVESDRKDEAKITAVPNWQELVREAIAKTLEEDSIVNVCIHAIIGRVDT